MNAATGDSAGRGRLLIGGVLALLLLIAGAVGGYALSQGSDPTSGEDGAADAAVSGVRGLEPGVPTILSADELRALGAEEGPVYWAGPREGTRYEVTVNTNGGIYIRYLPEGVEAGSEDLFLTVGTYDLLEGYDALTSASKSKADVVVSESGAAIATFKAAPLSTYFAFPDGTFQVEVFSPKKREARDLTESGAIGLITQP